MGSEHRSPCLLSKHFTHGAISPPQQYNLTVEDTRTNPGGGEQGLDKGWQRVNVEAGQEGRCLANKRVGMCLVGGMGTGASQGV